VRTSQAAWLNIFGGVACAEGESVIAGILPGRVVEATPVSTRSAKQVRRLELELTRYDGNVFRLDDPGDRAIFVGAFTGY
jgi:hypothetical protein